MIIAEIVQYKQPDIWLVLVRRYLIFLEDFEKIIREPPLPGRAGLLPGEDWKVVGL